MGASLEVLNGIPQRPPFLFVDEIVDYADKKIVTKKYLSGDEDFFKGHFPENPIMPGVLLSEATFQTGALLMSKMSSNGKCPLAVVSRITSTKFKNLVKPKDTLIIEVELLENLDNAYFMKGKIKVNDKVVMNNEFTCATIE
jgi:3-hydroxyacyl-[acyl-carrier-protein] dehydratase